MPKLIVTTVSGEQRIIDADEGLSAMEIIRDSGVDEVLAICGGCCSCATCHVYVDPGWLGRLPEVSEEEDALLDGSAHRRPNSRLSCQIPFTSALDGLIVAIAPED
jgi:ferredoxin, 2Fe-2S